MFDRSFTSNMRREHVEILLNFLGEVITTMSNFTGLLRFVSPDLEAVFKVDL